jgi:hypothetical protein
MKMNWTIITLFGAGVLVLLYFLIKSNKRDEQEYEKNMNEDYPKPKERIKDIDIDDTMH